MAIRKRDRQDFIGMAAIMGVKQLGKMYSISPKTAQSRLYNWNTKAVSDRWPPPKISVTDLTAILENYFGMPLHLGSASLFSRDRIRIGICVCLLNKHARVCMKQMDLHYHTARKHMEYAQCKAPDQINFLNSLISQHAN